jgi:hypothetical protein
MNLAVLISGMSVNFLLVVALVNFWYYRSFKKDRPEVRPEEVRAKKVADEERP